MHGASEHPGAELRGRIIAIAGAGNGFGRGAAREFARAGASLVLAAGRHESLNELADECERLGGRALVVPTDLSSEYEVENLVRQAVAIFGWIDVWVNHAGTGAVGKFESVPLTDHVRVIGTDLMGTLFGSYFAYRQFLKQGTGTLINISSELDKTAMPYYAAYTAAKHGVVGLTVSLRHEVRQNPATKNHIHICLVRPLGSSEEVIGELLQLAIDPTSARNAMEPARQGAQQNRTQGAGHH